MLDRFLWCVVHWLELGIHWLERLEAAIPEAPYGLRMFCWGLNVGLIGAWLIERAHDAIVP